MTRCEELAPLVSERASGPLGAVDEERLAAHLAACAACRAALAASEDALGLARVPRSRSFEARARDGLARGALAAWKRRQRRRVALFTLGGGFVAAAAAASIALAPALSARRVPGPSALPATFHAALSQPAPEDPYASAAGAAAAPGRASPSAAGPAAGEEGPSPAASGATDAELTEAAALAALDEALASADDEL